MSSAKPSEVDGVEYRFYEDGAMGDGERNLSEYEEREEKQQNYLESRYSDDGTCDVLSPPIQLCLEEISKQFPAGVPEPGPEKAKRSSSSLASLGLLKNFRGERRLNVGRRVEPSKDVSRQEVESTHLSTEEVMRLAASRFVQSVSQAVDIASMLHNPFGFSFSGRSDDEAQDVGLAGLLLAAAEKVSNRQFERASRLLDQCDCLSSNTGNPVQRLVYYFSGALRERIDRETGRIMMKGFRERQSFDPDRAMKTANPATIACHQKIPFCQVAQFAGMQAILENVAGAKRIHVIDIEIRFGVQWTVLMQALASQPETSLEFLKISAIGTSSREFMEDTGNRLANFAASIHLPFSYNVIMVADLLHLKEHLFHLDDEEKVVVYSEYFLRTLIVHPDRLDSMMRVVTNLNPCLMVVVEVEADINSTSFVKRFIECLFFFGAYFDAVDACLQRDDQNRMITESMYFREGIRNMVAAEGSERRIRNVKIDVWRAFFARFGMREKELSMSSMYQAQLVLQKFACGGSCTLDMDDKTLLIGWKAVAAAPMSISPTGAALINITHPLFGDHLQQNQGSLVPAIN